MPQEITSPTTEVDCVVLPLRTATAWDSIGWDDGLFRIKGGRTTYEAVVYDCERNAENVRLERIEVLGNMKLRIVRRYVRPETLLEFVSR